MGASRSVQGLTGRGARSSNKFSGAGAERDGRRRRRRLFTPAPMAMGIRTWRTIKLRSDLHILPLRRDWAPQNSQTEPTSTKCSLKSQQGASPKQDCPPQARLRTSNAARDKAANLTIGSSNLAAKGLPRNGRKYLMKMAKKSKKNEEGFHPPVSSVFPG